ncbi:hypothetical protein AGABI1DRAFT_125657 [Agaricus bisporus var. burnettii JB137-S8]|uniref:Uncharacterized protein n=1 Tax=Agaricus bisporus var. burnettii (strain JB137-S8 / ATCC MYA-4627 / FGSC 10392) TaxID=597362 RepID=K5XIP6_AGABU|nr:uncharacterized protein AGABI1DRAFT_125657 [Agaricus bisporus var. burnettii JB137-S8]EKM83182.1 hypothetical protein AGABI1DRAFT_125657 [Agaricus bisporus var. burnettii JB137-S8]
MLPEKSFEPDSANHNGTNGSADDRVRTWRSVSSESLLRYRQSSIITVTPERGLPMPLIRIVGPREPRVRPMNTRIASNKGNKQGWTTPRRFPMKVGTVNNWLMISRSLRDQCSQFAGGVVLAQTANFSAVFPFPVSLDHELVGGPFPSQLKNTFRLAKMLRNREATNQPGFKPSNVFV